MLPALHVLLIEDNSGDARLVMDLCAADNFVVSVAKRLSEALLQLDRSFVHVVLADLNLPDSEGLETIRSLLHHAPHLPIVVLTGWDDEEVGSRAIREGAQDYLVKGQIDGTLLYRTLRYAVNRKQAELALHERTEQLVRANQELEAFSYTVAHDLRNPLSQIQAYIEMILDDEAPHLREETQQILRWMYNSAQRMSGLIGGLLDFSKASQDPLTRHPIDLTALAQSIILDLQRRDPSRAVDFVIAPHMVVHGDITLVRIVLDNLLDNAWKYTQNVPTPRLEVGQQLQEGETTYFVRDNGDGFDMALIGELFRPFRRLHLREAYPGTGIGLATCKRVVERHGGRIWAEAQVQGGATFYFTIADLP